ncbi:FkbM family methyltransferase [Bradyrhizobium sp. 200]|uniref:FkbM family methyltransferase n=1 Tax=Bradyrhizobium sp. 200 TaxID=2782665 RepID=UPI001FFE9EED|nr:FkbM family methyltransferase [Bradyrhizobium sp. 200]UPJ51733.1 FkbM family methyltransferase [Bradyrhizobium sp. 200]
MAVEILPAKAAGRMRKILEKISASLVSAGIYLLHNRNTPRFSREEIRNLRLSFSQFGEDVGLDKWFDDFFQIRRGVYVDVGAFHPIRYSNTLLLYKKGWRGVNIDMNADKIALFKKLRPNDVNVHAAVNNASGTARALHSGLIEEMIFDPDGDVPVRRLNEILAETPYRRIDYLDIDCEGHDYDALQSIDLDLYQPKVITIEALETEAASRLDDYLSTKGYSLKEKFHYTLLFVRDKAKT